MLFRSMDSDEGYNYEFDEDEECSEEDSGAEEEEDEDDDSFAPIDSSLLSSKGTLSLFSSQGLSICVRDALPPVHHMSEHFVTVAEMPSG